MGENVKITQMEAALSEHLARFGKRIYNSGEKGRYEVAGAIKFRMPDGREAIDGSNMDQLPKRVTRAWIRDRILEMIARVRDVTNDTPIDVAAPAPILGKMPRDDDE